MKRPVLSAVIAIIVVFLGLIAAGAATSGKTVLVQQAVLPGSPERVWPFFADLQGWPSWYRADDGTRMTYSVLTRGAAPGRHAVRHAEESHGTWWEEEVTAFDLNSRLEMVGYNTPGRKNWRQEVKLVAIGPQETRVTWTLEYEVSGPIMKLINKYRDEKYFQAYMEGGLKNIRPLIPSPEEWGPESIGLATQPAQTIDVESKGRANEGEANKTPAAH